MFIARMLPFVLLVGCTDKPGLGDRSSSIFAPYDAIPMMTDAVAVPGDVLPITPIATTDGRVCDASGACFIVQYSISCDDGSAECTGPTDGPGEPNPNPQPPQQTHKFSWSATDTQTYTRGTTKAVKTSYSVQVGPVQKAGDNLTNIQTKFEQTIKGYVKIEHTIPITEWEANGKKPLIGAGGLLNYDVTGTCGAETKLVNTNVTAEGDANTIALGFAGTLKLSASDGLFAGPDATLLGFSVGGQRVTTVDSGNTVELSIDSTEEQTVAMKVGDNPLRICQIKHFLKDAWGPNRNLMQSAMESAMNFLDAHGVKWTLTSNTPVVCKCTARVDLLGKCADFPSWLWATNAGSVSAVVQQFDEQAILQCAGFSQGAHRPATENGLQQQVTAWNAEAHELLDNQMLERCNNQLFAQRGHRFGPRYGYAKVLKLGTPWKDRTITCAPSPN